ncbi:hypothetical protein AHMF7605_18850 [Adhaeribacter arboris]|uniref:SnoaL-like domain-containing protein n=1 Tax=Adhaeribacter arboris TaxID=2072846 RepID=A0A2T2YIT6_9BACT|nr:nuclear transport factor 2 family protein [Adhaeribacter arboris]PSR55416.1 hypothetical protein AHMF7605_18850 [Adhaeribacter arboris]
MKKLLDIKAIAQRYIAFSNAVDYESIADLFDEDAEWIPISPIKPLKGREAIRTAYLNQVKKVNKPIINDKYFADGFTCIVEFEVQIDENTIAAIVDVFTFNEQGKIIRLAVYKR